MFFNSYLMVYLLRNEISVLTHDFQQITKNSQIPSSLRRVQNHAEKNKKLNMEIKHQIDVD